MKRIAVLCLLMGLLWGNGAVAQDNNPQNGRISGIIFGDFYWIPYNHDARLEGNNGFWIRRIYLTYDKNISDSFSSRLRLEMNSEGDFLTDSRLIPSVKDAYLKWNRDHHSIYAGIASTPTWDLVEDVWGYRSVEKSPLDLQKFGSSRDMGIALKGKLGSEQRVGYHFMFGNGSGNKTELNRQKKYMLALSVNLTEKLVAQAYGDYNGRENSRGIYTAQLFVGYESDVFSAGALYAYQFRNNTLQDGDLNLDLASVFIRSRFTQKLKWYLRADHMFDPNPLAPGIDYLPMDGRASSTLIIGGLDIELDPAVHLMPNIEFVAYGETPGGLRPQSDLVPRLTLMYRY